MALSKALAGAEDGGIDDSVDDSTDDGVIGLQFFMNETQRLGLEFFFGGSAAKRRWGREAEDTEDFRW